MRHYEDIDALYTCGRPGPPDEQATYRAEIRFSVQSLPIPQPRQRHRVIQTRGRTYASNYTPARHPVQAFKQFVQMVARAHHRGDPLEGAIRLECTFRFPLPTSAPKVLKQAVVNMEHPPVSTRGRNDFDNLLKSVADSLTGILWVDDGQIAEGTWRKVYAIEAGVDVRVTQV